MNALFNKRLLEDLKFSQDSFDYSEMIYNKSALEKEIKKQRRKIIATSLQVCESICPQIFEATKSVKSTLSSVCDIEAFIYSDSTPQALNFGGEKNCAYIMLSSGLVDLLNRDELTFVIGHETAHFLFKHYLYPSTEMARNEVEWLNLLATKRAAEISCDRVGFACVTEKSNAYSAIIKLLSGLSDKHLRFDIKAYLNQVETLFKPDSKHNIISGDSHPTFSIRLRALLYFQMSEPYYNLIQSKDTAPLSKQRLDEKIEKDIRVLGGYYVDEKNFEAINDLTFWAAFALFSMDKNLTKAEQSYLKRVYGVDKYNNAINFIKNNGQSCIYKKINEHIIKFRNTTASNLENNITNIEKHLSECAKIAGGKEYNKQNFIKSTIDSIISQQN